jgi:hypothetical protein
MNNNNIRSKRELILAKRKEYLDKRSDAFQGNRKERRLYLENIEQQRPSGLLPFQMEAGVGLLLSDSSLDITKSATSKTARLKIQQSKSHRGWLETITKVFAEYCASNTPIYPVGEKRSNMIEFDTMKCNDIYRAFMDLFYPKYDKTNTRKGITENIKPFITPVSLAFWFSGDGGRLDYGPNEGKAISLNSQGFTFEENNILAQAISENLNLQATVKSEKTDGVDQFRIDISGKSFDSFIRQVGSYIDPIFFRKITNC